MGLGGEAAAEAEVAAAGPFDEGAPDGGGELAANELMPEAIGSLVEIRHRQVGQDRADVLRSEPPSSPPPRHWCIDERPH
jgi:hypothetical protein